MSVEFKVPELGEGVDRAEISQIYVSEGDTIDTDENVMELETDKAVADLPCPHAGTITKIHVSEGDTIEIGQTIMTLDSGPSPEEDTGEEASDKSSKKATQGKRRNKTRARKQNGEKDITEEESPQQKTNEAEPEADQHTETPRERGQQETAADESAAMETDEPPQKSEDERPTGDEDRHEAAQNAESDVKAERERRSERPGREAAADHDDDEADAEEAEDEGVPESDTLPPQAGPATRRLARRLGVDLETVEARDPSGRITQEDVVAAHDRLRESSHQPDASQPALPDFGQFGSIRREPLNKIARTAMERLQASWCRIPQVTQHDLSDITELEFARRNYLARQSDSVPKITITAIVIKAVTSLLVRYPKFNASLDSQAKELIFKEYYHIGVAVDTDHGLLVPVILDANHKNVIEVAEELEELAHRARQRKLRREEMEGATFTVSNQGSIGGTSFTPIVTHPQVAILGLSRAESQMKLIDEQPRQRLLLPLSLSYDHRVVNGADAARFLAQLAEDLSNYFQILLHA